MKLLTITAMISMLSVTMARDVFFEHKRALNTISKRQNLATFTGALGGATATPVTCSGDAKRPFQVKADTFVNFGAAAQRSCDQQNNACSNAANSGGDFSVGDCNAQQQQCIATQTASAATCDSGAAAAATGNANANANAGANTNAGNANAGNANAGANSTAAATTGTAQANCGSAKRRRNVQGAVKV